MAIIEEQKLKEAPEENLSLQNTYYRLITYRNSPDKDPKDTFRLLDNDSVTHAFRTYWQNTDTLYSQNPAVTGPHEHQQYESGRAFEYFLSVGLPRGRMTAEEPITAEELANTDAVGYHFFEQMLRYEDSQVHTGVVNFLAHNLWDGYRNLQEAHNEDLREERRRQFDRRRDIIVPLLHEAADIAAERDDKTELKTIFLALKNVQGDEFARGFLLDERLTESQRMATAVGYINAYGFINGIDVIAHAVNNEALSENVREQLTEVYSRFEKPRQKLTHIRDELQKVYEAVDFRHYTLNGERLTREEYGRVMRIANDYAKRHGIPVEDLQLLDVGAGTGRHAVPLHAQGYQVTALETQPEHIAAIREQNPDITVIAEDWHHLAEVLPAGSEHIAYSLGRTLNHNRTAMNMFQTFDQIRQVLAVDGEFVFDQPDIWGKYANEIAELNENLEHYDIDEVPDTMIFDGPDASNLFNRRVLTPEQINSLAALLGFEVISSEDPVIGENQDIRNVYYHLRKNPNFNPRNIPTEVLRKHIEVLGLLKGITREQLQLPISAWGMSVAQAEVAGLQDSAQEGDIEVRVNEVGKTMNLERIQRELKENEKSKIKNKNDI